MVLDAFGDVSASRGPKIDCSALTAGPEAAGQLAMVLIQSLEAQLPIDLSIETLHV